METADKAHIQYLRLAAAILILGAVSLGIWLLFRGQKETDHVPRALAARQTALALASMEEIKAAYAGAAEAGQQEAWYGPYAAYLYEKGIWREEELPADAASMDEAVTGEDIFLMGERLGFSLPEELPRGREPLTEKEWQAFYRELLKTCDSEGAVTETELTLVGTPNVIPGAGAWQAYTDQGVYSFEGLSLDALTDRRLSVMARGTELLMVTEVLKTSVTYENIWLEQESGTLWRAWICGTWRELSIPGAGEECDGAVADLFMEEGKVEQVSLKKERITGTVLAMGDTEAELEGYGKIPLSEQFHVYRLDGTFAELERTELSAGYDQAEFVIAGGKLCAALIGELVTSRNIRVLLTDAAIGSIFHERAVFTADQDFTVSFGDGSVQRYQAGETVEIEGDDGRLAAGNIRIQTDEGGRIGFTSFSRKYGEPWYEGAIELSRAEEGLLIINDVDLETYLCYVVPSEMPESYGLEALKAQAVCARSYACRQMQGSSYEAYGAHVDDSTAFQVYNNTETDDLTRQAVEETEGEVVTWNGELVTTYYYATSSGYGNDMGVWGSSPEDYPYLSSLSMTEGEAPDLSGEEAFRGWLEEKDEKNLEYSSPWYRWETEVSDGMMKELVDSFLTGYAREHPDLVAFRQGEETGSIGRIRSVTVEKRAVSGVADTVVVEGESGTIEVRRQGAIRELFGSGELAFTRQDGSVSTGKSILPSATVCFEATEGGWRILGAGYGHGVGMSQTAASTMAGRGMDHREILAYFYPGTETAGNYGQ